MKYKWINKITVIAMILSVMMLWTMTSRAAENVPEMDHSNMEHSSPGDAGAVIVPADARDPHAYSSGYAISSATPHNMGDQTYMAGLMINRLEAVRAHHNTFNLVDLQGWVGKDYDRLLFKVETEIDSGKLHNARTELLWGHATAPFWNTQLGMRHDSGEEPDQNWLALGVQGLAPYWFEVDATFYAGDQGRTAARVEAEYELLITQKLVLQPSIEVNIYGKSDPIREIGSGLSDAQVGLRLRYEFTRQFAPYIGLEWAGKVGKTADFARSVGEKTSETRLVAGVRFWF